MSVWVKSKAKVLENVDKKILSRACEKMGFTMDETIKSISNNYGKDQVDAGLRLKDKVQDIGFSFEKAKGKTELNVKGDFYFVKGYNEITFIDKLSNEYQKINVVEKAQINGYSVESQKELQNGDTEIMLYAY